MDESFALKVQQLSRADDRVLVVAEVQSYRVEDRWIRASEIETFFEALRLPRVSNIPRSLTSLRNAGLVVQRSSDRRWTLTPLGRRQVLELVGMIDHERIQAATALVAGSEFDNRRHPLVSHIFAPPQLAVAVEEFLREYPFETNIFCMTRFPLHGNGFSDPIKPTLDTLEAAASDHKLTLHIASGRQLEDQLFGNVSAFMWACQFGIGILEDRVRRGLNHNVMIELGAMLMTGRRCALLRDRSIPKMPSDIAGHIYKSVDLDDQGQIAGVMHAWLSEDLALGRCGNCS